MVCCMGVMFELNRVRLGLELAATQYRNWSRRILLPIRNRARDRDWDA